MPRASTAFLPGRAVSVPGSAERPRPGADDAAIQHSASAPPFVVPPGHIGPVVLPGTGRLVWWTGRVAIGLRHQPESHRDAMSQSALWVQDLMLAKEHRVAAR